MVHRQRAVVLDHLFQVRPFDELHRQVVQHRFAVPWRRDLAGVSRGRADIIPAGAVILSEFVNRFPVSGVYVSTRGLRYGLVLSEARKVWRPQGEPVGN